MRSRFRTGGASAPGQQAPAGLAQQARALAVAQGLELAADVRDRAEADDGPGGERGVEVRGALLRGAVALDRGRLCSTASTTRRAERDSADLANADGQGGV
jgi:hypothetical protein